ERGTLVRRYQRFLADIELPDGRLITIHCPNTGSMKNCAEPGDEVWYSTSSNPSRKYACTWELSRTRRGHYIGVNTGRANELIQDAIQEGIIQELSGYTGMKREVGYGKENSRIDLLLTEHDRWPDCYVEVKSVTLLEQAGRGYFPDAVSDRGTRHLRELMEVVRSGARGVLCFCVQHSAIRSVSPAVHIDHQYSATLQSAIGVGVEVLAYKARMSPSATRIQRPVPVVMP
ncbi:MAG: DNA/RNA nuclease SfsA, partial [Pseudomonadales bacterium]